MEKAACLVCGGDPSQSLRSSLACADILSLSGLFGEGNVPITPPRPNVEILHLAPTLFSKLPVPVTSKGILQT